MPSDPSSSADGGEKTRRRVGAEEDNELAWEAIEGEEGDRGEELRDELSEVGSAGIDAGVAVVVGSSTDFVVVKKERRYSNMIESG